MAIDSLLPLITAIVVSAITAVATLFSARNREALQQITSERDRAERRVSELERALKEGGEDLEREKIRYQQQGMLLEQCNAEKIALMRKLFGGQ